VTDSDTVTVTRDGDEDEDDDDVSQKMTDASGHMKRSSTATNCCMRDGQRQIGQ